MRDYYGDPSAPRPSPNQAPYLTPYLGLRARLSQVWINQWTVLLLLVLVRVLIAIGGASDMIDDARAEALSACTSVEKIGSAFASMPHYMSQGVNSLTATGLSKAVNGAQTMLDLTLTGVEEMIIFYIGMLTNTYLCLITLAVSGSLHAVVDVLTAAQGDLNKTLSAIGDDIGSTANTLQTGINDLVGGINTVLSKSTPQINFTTQINELKNLQLPTDLNADLLKLNGSIPTFDDVKNATETVISAPFEALRTLIKNEWGNYTFNQSLFPVPEKKGLSFCSGNNNINNFFDDLRNLASKAKKIFIGVLLTLALLACVPKALMEIRKWNRLPARARKVHSFTTDPIDTVYLSSRPYTSDVGRALAGRFHSNRRQTLVRWCVAYSTSLPALFLISLALTGFFACFCQWVLLKIITKEVPALTAEIVGFADDVVQTLNNASSHWATDANAVVLGEANKLNTDLLGWVNTSTVAVNNTLNKFVDETVSVLNTTFGGTPLYDPIKGVFDCLIGLKIKGIESGLTWVHDHAQISFPMLPNDTMTIGALLSKSNSEGADFFSDPTTTTQNDVSAAINKVGNMILKGIRQEALISLMLLLAWLIIFLIGIVSIMITFYKHGSPGAATFPNEYHQQDVSNMFENPQSIQSRTVTPAPAYSNGNPDVNSQAPFALNPHTFPQTSGNDDFQEKHGVTSREVVFPTANQFQAQPINYNNEKNGYI